MKQEKIPRLGYRTLDEAVRDFQIKNFDRRYVNACLSKLDLDDWISSSIAGYMKDPKNMMLFHGKPGIGKTYICSAMVEWAFKSFNYFRYFSEKDLLKRLRTSINDGAGDYAATLEYLIDDDLVFLDDVGSGINPDKIQYKDLEWKREVFFHFLDYRYNSEKPTIITSNLSEDDFEKIYSERICSRLFAKENTIISVFSKTCDKRKLGF